MSESVFILWYVVTVVALLLAFLHTMWALYEDYCLLDNERQSD